LKRAPASKDDSKSGQDDQKKQNDDRSRRFNDVNRSRQLNAEDPMHTSTRQKNLETHRRGELLEHWLAIENNGRKYQEEYDALRRLRNEIMHTPGRVVTKEELAQFVAFRKKLAL
jgi:hypothetical protein